MRIGKLVNISGLSRDTIRFYERQGVIASVAEIGGANNYRDYPDELVERLQVIQQAQAAGFSLADLRELFGLTGDVDYPGEVEGYLDGKIAEVEDKLVRISGFLKMLKSVRTALDAPN